MPPRIVALLLLGLVTLPARSDSPETAASFDFGIDLRYRYEGVEQDGPLASADANTLRVRAHLASRTFAGFSGLVEVDHVEGIGAQQYNDTRNGEIVFPVVADPEGTDLNQAWLQYTPRADTRVRIGRQRVNLDNQRFVGSSDWRQNEQTLDAIDVETTAIRRLTVTYAFVDRVNRVFGPDAGSPPASFNGASHLLNVKLSPFAAGSIVGYAYLLDVDEAPQLSSRSIGARYDGSHAIRERLSAGWAVEYADQRDSGGNPLEVNASYALLELRLTAGDADFSVGQEILSGVAGNADPAASPSFQTPLATLHKWQGWADKFLTTPPEGIHDTFVGLGFRRPRWRVQAVWHDFTADATSLHFGTEMDALAAVKLEKGPELLLKYADFRADGQLTDTQKFWAQLSWSF
jgi:alginate export protein